MAIAGRYRSQADLITKVLGNLGVLAVGQGQDPEDTAIVQNNLDSIFRKIAGLEICFVSDPNNIPGEWFVDLADIVAGELCTQFGSSPEDFAKLVNKGLGGINGVDVGFGAAAKSLRAISRGKPTFERLRVEYF